MSQMTVSAAKTEEIGRTMALYCFVGRSMGFVAPLTVGAVLEISGMVKPDGINSIALFFKKHLESDAGAFHRSSDDFAVGHNRVPGVGKIKFHGDLLPGK